MIKSTAALAILTASLSYATDTRPLHVQISEDRSAFSKEGMFNWQSDSTATSVIYLHFQTPMMQDSDYVFHEFVEIAEDYWPFRVNVTTDSTVYNNTPLEKKMRMQYNDKAPITNYGECVGDSFGKESGQNECWIKYDGRNGSGSHEIGHSFNLRHDFSYDSPGYQKGSANFVPIMGRGTEATGSGEDMKYRTFWNLSPYAFAQSFSNRFDAEIQHDFKVIEEYIPKREDDISDKIEEARSIIVNSATINSDSNWSHIGYDKYEHTVFGDNIDSLHTDKDMWRLYTTGGQLQLEITPTVQYNNLHLVTSLYDSDGELISMGIPLDNGHTVKQASRLDTHLEEGTYYIKVEPTGQADNSYGLGYPVYGSVGYYQFTGTLEGGITAIKGSDFERNTHQLNLLKVYSLEGELIQVINEADMSVAKIIEKFQLGYGVYFLISNNKTETFYVK